MLEEKDNNFIKAKYRSTSKVEKDYKTNPFEKYSGKFSTSFGTLLLGIMLGVIGLVLLGYSEGIDNDMNIVRRSPLIKEGNLIRSSGMIKLSGVPTTKTELKVSGSDENLLYYTKTIEEKIDGKWMEVNKQHVFAPFSIGDVYVDASEAKLEFDLTDISQEETDNRRETVRGVFLNNEIVVIGSLKNGEIRGGVVFIVTNKSNKDLLRSISNMGTTEWWVYKIGALLLITLGITSFVLPILTFLDIFPELGLPTIGLIFLFAFLMAALVVFIAAVVITFWWLIFVIVGLLLILLIRIKSKNKYRRPISFVP